MTWLSGNRGTASPYYLRKKENSLQKKQETKPLWKKGSDN